MPAEHTKKSESARDEDTLGSHETLKQKQLNWKDESTNKEEDAMSLPDVGLTSVWWPSIQKNVSTHVQTTQQNVLASRILRVTPSMIQGLRDHIQERHTLHMQIWETNRLSDDENKTKAMTRVEHIDKRLDQMLAEWDLPSFYNSKHRYADFKKLKKHVLSVKPLWDDPHWANSPQDLKQVRGTALDLQKPDDWTREQIDHARQEQQQTVKEKGLSFMEQVSSAEKSGSVTDGKTDLRSDQVDEPTAAIQEQWVTSENAPTMTYARLPELFEGRTSLRRKSTSSRIPEDHSQPPAYGSTSEKDGNVSTYGSTSDSLNLDEQKDQGSGDIQIDEQEELELVPIENLTSGQQITIDEVKAQIDGKESAESSGTPSVNELETGVHVDSSNTEVALRGLPAVPEGFIPSKLRRMCIPTVRLGAAPAEEYTTSPRTDDKTAGQELDHSDTTNTHITDASSCDALENAVEQKKEVVALLVEKEKKIGHRVDESQSQAQDGKQKGRSLDSHTTRTAEPINGPSGGGSALSNPLYESGEMFIELLLDDRTIVELLIKAKNAMSRTVMHHSMCRLLGVYHADMKTTGCSSIQQEVIAPLATAARRETIVEIVINKVASRTLLHKTPPYEHPIDDSSNETQIDPTYQSILLGQPYETLLISLKISLLPAELLEEILPIPRKRIKYETMPNHVILGSMQSLLERVTGLDWDWWPVRPRLRLLQAEESLVHWQCFCGMNRWWSLSADQQVMLRDVLAHCPADSSPLPFCALLRPIKRQRQKRFTKMQSSGPASDQSTDPPPSNSKTTKYTPTSAASTSSGGVGSTLLPQINAVLGTGPVNAQDGQASSLARSGLNELLWITFGVEGSQSTPEVDQISSDDQTFDQIFIKELRSRHRRLRGWMRSYLSIWRLHYWEFVKFGRIPLKTGRAFVEDVDLPESAEYKYAPRPPEITASHPGVKHIFEVMVQLCLEPCALASLPVGHTCYTLPANGRHFVGRIPKRNKEWNLNSDDIDDPYVWGMQARYIPCVYRIWVIHFLILGTTFGFWGLWQRSHPEDLQGASVPLTVASVLMSLFWSSTGVLKGLR